MAVDRGQLQNVSKPNHCKNCNAMQITEGLEWYHKCLCGKGKSANHYKVQCDAKVEHTGIKKRSAKTG